MRESKVPSGPVESGVREREYIQDLRPVAVRFRQVEERYVRSGLEVDQVEPWPEGLELTESSGEAEPYASSD